MTRAPGATSLGLVIAAVALGVAACAAPAPPSAGPAGPSAASVGATASPPASSVSASPASPPTTSGPPSTAPASPGDGVVQDPSLISLLPADVAGIPVTLEEQAFADAAADPAFASNVEGAAFGVVVDGADLASAVVAHLAPGVYSESFFRDWRDTYDEGACAQSGGVVGNAEAKLGPRTVFIGTCAGGLRTYHAWIEDRGVVVSAFSIGDRRFGEQLMSGLRP